MGVGGQFDCSEPLDFPKKDQVLLPGLAGQEYFKQLNRGLDWIFCGFRQSHLGFLLSDPVSGKGADHAGENDIGANQVRASAT